MSSPPTINMTDSSLPLFPEVGAYDGFGVTLTVCDGVMAEVVAEVAAEVSSELMAEVAA